MKRVDSQALDTVTRALGLTGAGAPMTELTDGEVSQVLSVGEIVRRGRTLAITQGLHSAVLRNVHPGAGSLTTEVIPYNIAVGTAAPFPAPVPAGFDLWLIAANVQQTAGAGTIAAILTMVYPGANLAWGVNNSGVAIAPTFDQVLAHWDTIVTVSGVTFAIQGGVEQPSIPLGLRLPRSLDTLLRWTTTASAAADFDLHLLIGLFPVSLGQDAAI